MSAAEGPDFRKALIDYAVRRVIVAAHFERDGVPGVVVGKVSSVDSRAARIAWAREDPYCIPISAIRRLEAVEDGATRRARAAEAAEAAE